MADEKVGDSSGSIITPKISPRYDSFVEVNYRKDPMYLHPSDNPSLQLVATQLTLTNYLVWSRVMKRALKAKKKVGFIDGSCKQPEDETSEAYLQWSFVDSMVASWLVNSMTKELADAYAYTPSAGEIWNELEEKYGESDRPRIFHLKKEMGAIELVLILLLVILISLNDSYDNVVNNVLMMDPLPSFNKVHSIVARIEKQINVNSIKSVNKSIEASALAVKSYDSSSKGSGQRSKKKEDRFCVFCHKQGHTEDACFKKHGVPDWWKEKYPKDKKVTAYANIAASSAGDEAGQKQVFDSSSIAELIQKEMKKFMKNGKIKEEDTPLTASYFSDFAGNISISRIPNAQTRWIIDSGASSHVCGVFSLMTHQKGNHTAVSSPSFPIVFYDEEVQEHMSSNNSTESSSVIPPSSSVLPSASTSRTSEREFVADIPDSTAQDQNEAVIHDAAEPDSINTNVAETEPVQDNLNVPTVRSSTRKKKAPTWLAKIICIFWAIFHK
ncbi:uncharacterized protein G2W53_013907 [Senna tora]|uniref:Retrotransposon Copia-like N-terminal domain-containing protein n=1 Tax=Senna tora TaxID=362788 RepID=A0A834WSV0_9FABA|nr:uncharacterized protein G2W53_013907 [Senna tora]